MFKVSEKYRSFRAENKYSYPGLFLVLGCGRAVLEFAVVFAVVGFAAHKLINSTQQENRNSMSSLASKSSAVAVAGTLTGYVDAAGQVEVPAAVSPETSPWQVSAGTYNADWLLQQDAGAYVVQLSSSTDKTGLYQKAFEYSDNHLTVVYPFKKTRTNQLMYGYSLGMHKSVADAEASVAYLDKNAVVEGVWIRAVGDIQKQILEVR